MVVDDIQDYFTEEFREEEGLFSLHEALKQIHNPDDKQSLQSAVYRLKYDEHFFLQLLMALKRQAKEENSGRVFSQRGKYEKDIFKSLDFSLTDAQINVLKEIRDDLAREKVQ